MAKIVRPTDTNPAHHITLSDGQTTVGFILINNKGVRDVTAFQRYPIQTTALKTYQGSIKHSDMVYPYISIAQEDWSGGQNKLIFEDDKTGFLRSRGIDALNESSLVLGPQARYAEGYRSANQHMPSGNFEWLELNGFFRYAATSFVAGSAYNLSKMRFFAKKRGRPGTGTAAIWSNSSGEPGSELASETFTAGDVVSAFKKLTTYVELSNGVTYWFVVYGAATDDANNTIKVGYSTGSGGKISANGTSWSNWSGQLFFRVTDDDHPFVAHFYEYQGQLYFAAEYDERNYDSKIYMNGYRGACDSCDPDYNKLKDSTQTGWTSAKLSGGVARLVSGIGGVERQDWRLITGGGSGYATVSPDWNIDHSTADDYVILNLDTFAQISQPAAVDGKITDVAVANGVLYVCRGELDNMWKHREYNNDGTWTAGTASKCWKEIEGVASKIVSHNDPISGPVLWLGYESMWGAGGIGHPHVMKALAPKRWDSDPLGSIKLHDLRNAWDEQTPSNVFFVYDSAQRNQSCKVIQGKMTAINATPTAPGSDYQVDDVLTVKEWSSPPSNYEEDAGMNGTVTVVSVDGGGGVTEISLTTAGNDYSVGAGKATSGGNGTGCTIEVTGISNFGTGVFVSEAIGPLDLRYTSKIWLLVKSSIHLDAGDIQFLVDDTANCASPLLALDMPTLKAEQSTGMYLSYDPDAVSGLDKTISIGAQLTASKPTFTLDFYYGAFAYADSEPIPVGQPGDNLTGLDVYGEPETVWAFTDGGMGEIRNDLFSPIPLRELRTVKHPNNGIATTVNDVYLITSIGDSVNRYFRQNLENIGPNKDAGMGTARGMPVKFLSFPGRVYVALDGGDLRVSTVVCWKNRAWHEVYTSGIGERIRNMYVQSIPGKSYFKLWISVGSDVVWVPIEFNTHNLPGDSDYCHVHEGYLETSWIYTEMRDIPKLFKSIVIFAEGLSAGHYFVDVDYRLDNQEDWTQAWGTANVGPVHEIELSKAVPPSNVRGYRIAFRLRLMSDHSGATPCVKATVLKSYGIVPVKYGYTWLTRMAEKDLSYDLEGNEQKTLGQFNNVEEASAQLDAWAHDLTPLSMTSVFSPLDSQIVMLRPLPMQPTKIITDEQIEEEATQITVEQV